MKVATAWSTSDQTRDGVIAAYEQLQQALGGTPDWLAIYASVGYDSTILMQTLKEIAPNLPTHGGTSCLGVMTASGFHSAKGMGLGLFGIKDPTGYYAVGVEDGATTPQMAGAAAVRKALAAAQRPEQPTLIWLTSAPGSEEDVVQGIESMLGPNVPIVGGSAADNTLEGHWQQFANGEVYTKGVVVTAMYTSTETHFAFRSGYYATSHRGEVTRASGRTVHTIDGRPAAEVYNEWTKGAIETFAPGSNVLEATTLHPIGRVIRQIGDMAFYRLSHPERITPDRGLTLFTNVDAGEEIILMKGTRQSLVARAGVVAQSALKSGLVSPDQIAGGLVIFCAGCMLAIQEEMEDVAKNISEALGGKPFLGAFTFGEQGGSVGGANYHGNLMISMVAFESGEIQTG